jgi:glutamine amidotransferase-like uncharacterized protein
MPDIFPPPALFRGVADFLRGRVSVGLYVEDGAWAPGLPNYGEMFSVKGLTVTAIPVDVINSGELLDRYGALAFPGGWAPGYISSIDRQGAENIRRLVEAGGTYLGVCAGSWFACDRITWRGRTYDYPLDLFPGVGHDTDSIVAYPDMKLTPIDVDLTPILPGVPILTENILLWGGPWFDIPEGFDAMVLARFTEGDVAGKPATIAYHYGRGKVLLWSAHPEMSKNYPSIWAMLDWAFSPPIP